LPILEKAAKVLDTKGLLCPMPVIKTSQAIKEVPVGGILEVLATDPGSKPDLVAWAKMTGNELVEMSEDEGNPKVFKFEIKRLK
jgi:tRNA 2-thiouridine synthesizing protein A